MNNENEKIDINTLSAGEKVNLVRGALHETYKSLQILEVKGQGNLQIALKAMNTITDIDSVLELVSEDILNLESPSEKGEGG